MPYCYRDPEVNEPPYIGAIRNIAALNPIAEILQYLSDSAHTDPADANEMQRTDRSGKCSHAARP
jgi:hypothetical protein